MRFKKVKFISFFLFIAFFGTGIRQSFAQGIVTFGPGQAKIDGTIAYSVLGQYRAQFSVFKGRITLDDNWQRIRSVYLDIEVNSIHSNSPWCDKMVRSRRLLNAARYPEIIFKSSQVVQDEDGYKVKGVLEMHGVKKRLLFPFKAEMTIDPYTKRKFFVIKGSWNINRKDFNIIWSRTLDRGGILVGDIFTVNWRIQVS